MEGELGRCVLPAAAKTRPATIDDAIRTIEEMRNRHRGVRRTKGVIEMACIGTLTAAIAALEELKKAGVPVEPA